MSEAFPELADFLDARGGRARLVRGIYLRWPRSLDGDPRLAVAADAVELLANLDPRRMRRLRRHSPVVEIAACRHSSFEVVSGCVWISPSATRVDTAAALVHHATAARLERVHAQADMASGKNRSRAERLCLLEEARFMRRIRRLERWLTSSEWTAIDRHATWLPKAFRHCDRWLTEGASMSGPAPDPRPEPAAGLTEHDTHHDWEAAELARFQKAVQDRKSFLRSEEELRRTPSDELSLALRETGGAAQRISSQLRASARKGSRVLRYWRDPWAAPLLEGA